jgi:hypothetical protein
LDSPGHCAFELARMDEIRLQLKSGIHGGIWCLLFPVAGLRRDEGGKVYFRYQLEEFSLPDMVTKKRMMEGRDLMFLRLRPFPMLGAALRKKSTYFN